jgi:hypothetical protein
MMNAQQSGIDQIASALLRNRTLRELDLACNELNARSLVSLAKSLVSSGFRTIPFHN